MFRIKVTNFQGTTRTKYFVFCLISLADALVSTLSLGFLTPCWREDALFAEWFEKR